MMLTQEQFVSGVREFGSRLADMLGYQLGRVDLRSRLDLDGTFDIDCDGVLTLRFQVKDYRGEFFTVRLSESVATSSWPEAHRLADSLRGHVEPVYLNRFMRDDYDVAGDIVRQLKIHLVPTVQTMVDVRALLSSAEALFARASKALVKEIGSDFGGSMYIRSKPYNGKLLLQGSSVVQSKLLTVLTPMDESYVYADNDEFELIRPVERQLAARLPRFKHAGVRVALVADSAATLASTREIRGVGMFEYTFEVVFSISAS
jgi:hypothetical protein